MGKVSKRLLLGVLGAATSFGMILGGKAVVDSVDNGASEVAAATGDQYVMVTSADELTDGKYLLVALDSNGSTAKVMTGSTEESSVGDKNEFVDDVFISDDKTLGKVIEWSSVLGDAPEWELKGSGQSWTIRSIANNYYIGRNDNSNGIDAGSTSYLNNITFSSGMANIAGNGGLIFQFNTSGYFRYYKANSSYPDVQLFKLKPGIMEDPESVVITLDGEDAGAALTIFDEDELTLEATVLPEGSDQSVTWSCDSDDVLFEDGYLYAENKTEEDYVVAVVAASTVDPTIKDEIEITVKPKIMTGIEIVKMPARTEYTVGSEFDSTGIEVQAVYKDGAKPIDVTDQIEYSHGTFTEFGEVEVIATLKGTEFAASIKVNVVDRVVELFDVSGEKTSFNVGDAFTLGDNVEISAMWNDEVFEEIAADSEDLSFELVDLEDAEIGSGTPLDSSYEMSLADNGKYVLVSYKGAAVSYQISVKEPFAVTNGQFVKVDSAEDLSIGDCVVVGYQNNMMANYESGDYISAVTFEHGDKFTLEPSDLNNIAVLELGEPFGSASNSSTFSLKQISGNEEQYLYCSGEKKISASSNATGLSSSASWQIVKSKDGFGIISQISNNYQLQYNTGSPRFTCYKGTMKDVELYKFVTYVEEATNVWAKKMMNSGICDSGVADSETWSLLELYYDDLSTGAQSVLQAYEADVSESASVLAQALYRYDYILDIYGTDKFNDYIGRGGTPSGAYSINHNGDDNLWAIAGLSLTGIVSAAALLVLRKKKRA